MHLIDNDDEKSTSSGSKSNEASNGKIRTRVGTDYQANLPRCEKRYTLPSTNTEVLVWKPNDILSNKELENYLFMARARHGYNIDQALALLLWHKHSIQKATSDIGNFLPFVNEWTDDEKTLFEQAFLCHGKFFSKIKTALPNKTHAEIVSYYYTWKRTRNHKSLLENYQNKIETNGDDNDDENKSDSDSDTAVCSNCNTVETKLESTAKGELCQLCFSYWKQTGVMRPESRYSLVNRTIQNKHFSSGNNDQLDKDSRRTLKSIRKPPKGIYLNYAELINLTELDQQDTFSRLDNTIMSYKKNIQCMKQAIGSLTNKFIDVDKIINNCDDKLRDSARKTLKWTQKEAELAVLGFQTYKKDFSAIADIIETKTEELVREFYEYHRVNSNLDEVITNKRLSKNPDELKSRVQVLLKGNTTPQASDDSNDDIIILQ